MRFVHFILISCLFIISLLSAAEEQSLKPEYRKYHFECWENFNIDVQGSTVVIRHFGPEGAVIEISKDGDLFIDQEEIKTDRQSRKLLQDYNHIMRSLISSAEKIGWEAIKIGGKGAELGLEAVSGILTALCTDLDIDDLEDHLEKKARKIESEANKLEEKARKLEEQASKLEEVHEQLKDRIVELEELEWF